MNNETACAFPTGAGGDPGLTKREHIATQIMAGMAASEGNAGEFWSDDEKMALRAVRRADKLLAELAK